MQLVKISGNGKSYTGIYVSTNGGHPSGADGSKVWDLLLYSNQLYCHFLSGMESALMQGQKPGPQYSGNRIMLGALL